MHDIFWQRLDENTKDEAQAMFNSLSIIETMLEMTPTLADDASAQGLLAWLLRRVKSKQPGQVKSYAAEILAIVLQNSDGMKSAVGELEGIDTLLQQLSLFKRRDPSGPEDRELMENVFDALCACLMVPANRGRFLKGEGLQLMNLLLRSALLVLHKF